MQVLYVLKLYRDNHSFLNLQMSPDAPGSEMEGLTITNKYKRR